jgi:hypothetical protein
MTLHGAVSCVSDVVFAFLRCELVEQRADPAPDGFLGAFGGLAEQVLEFGDDLLDCNRPV